jgi:hypothetical protein
MTDPASPFDELLDSLRAALLSRRRDDAARLGRIEAALNSYRRALEQQIAGEFAAEHRLKAPAKIGISLERAAEELRDAVLALPELSPVSLRSSPPSTVRTEPPVSVEPPSGWPRLRAALASQKLVVIGALSRDRSDSAPEGMSEHIEWIDTERDGVHALGNLPQRIRQGRVAAVVILDRAVKHKHSEPALAAARDAHVPTAFAGQGGRASLERALTQLEGMLAER